MKGSAAFAILFVGAMLGWVAVGDWHGVVLGVLAGLLVIAFYVTWLAPSKGGR